MRTCQRGSAARARVWSGSVTPAAACAASHSEMSAARPSTPFARSLGFAAIADLAVGTLG
jgi:hypothetical protein